MLQLINKAIGKYHYVKEQLCIAREIFRKDNKAFLFGSPEHSNMGDQAQTYCICDWIGRNYPGYRVVVFPVRCVRLRLLKLVKRCITASDLIFIHSGYHITDLYMVVEGYYEVIHMFPKHRIVVFPQTINFISDVKKQEFVSGVFNAHGNITLLCRDELSYTKAQIWFSGCKLLLYPDIVTSLIGEKRYENKRNGILFCTRNDIEAFYTKVQLEGLAQKLSGYAEPVDWTDTTLPLSFEYIKKNRQRILYQIFEEYSRYRLIITDRYHGTIFSLVAGTPVIVLASTDHKLSSGVKWFPESYRSYVIFAKDLDEAYSKAVDILAMKSRLNYSLSDYFKVNYYDILKNKLEN